MINISYYTVPHHKSQQVPGCPYVLATQTGKYLSYRNLLAMMGKACEAAEGEHRGLHALRHSFASNLYARDVEGEDHLEAAGSRQRGDMLLPTTAA